MDGILGLWKLELQRMSMEIETTRHVDTGGPRPRGLENEYRYEIYRFSQGGTTLVARSYSDQPQAAHLLRIETPGKTTGLTVEDLSTPLCREAVSYLRDIGKQEIKWLNVRGYEALPY